MSELYPSDATGDRRATAGYDCDTPTLPHSQDKPLTPAKIKRRKQFAALTKKPQAAPERRFHHHTHGRQRRARQAFCTAPGFNLKRPGCAFSAGNKDQNHEL